MDFPEINEYITKLRNRAGYDALSEKEQKEVVFEATELLQDHFADSDLTARHFALQTIYALESEKEGFGRLKRQGVKSYAVKGVSVSFEGTGISPDVIALVGSKKAMIGRFYS